MDLIADTSFLVGLWRRQAWALTFAREYPAKVLGFPWVVRGEFWHGAMRAGHDSREVEQFLALGLPLDESRPYVLAYARVAATLQEKDRVAYQQIGQNDLWIAAVAVETQLPLLSRNRRHFDKIEGLTLEVLQIGREDLRDEG